MSWGRHSRGEWQPLDHAYRQLGGVGDECQRRFFNSVFRDSFRSLLASFQSLSPAPVTASALTPPEYGTMARTYPTATRRSRCASGMVRCIGRVPTSFKEANSSAVSRTLRRANRGSGFSFAMGSNKTRGLSQSTHEKSPGRRLHVIYVSRSRLS